MPLKVLVIDRSPPTSLRQGNALIAAEVLSRLAHHDLTLVAPASPEELDAAPRHLAGIFRSVHLVPRDGWTPALTGSIEPAMAARIPRAPGFDLSASRALSTRVRELVREGGYDLVHVRQLPMARYGRIAGPSGRLLELIDSETLGAERARPITGRTRLRARVAARVERRAMDGFDVVTTVADADADRLRALAPGARVEVVPNGVDARRFRPEPNAAVNPWSLVFVGVMSYPPNIAAMRYLTEDVLPIVRRAYPRAHLTIVGRDPGSAVREMASDAVEVTGEVDDVRPFLARSALFVAPMVSGSGIKNKVLEAMAMGLPVVATPLGVEGLPIQDGEHAVIAAGTSSLAAAIGRLLADDDERSRIGRAGRVLVERTYTWEACAAHYERLYHDVARRAGSPR